MIRSIRRFDFNRATASCRLLAALVLAAIATSAAADQLIQKYDASLTSYLTVNATNSPNGKTRVQHVHPRVEEREVNIDGTPDVPPEDLTLAASAGLGRPWGYGRGLGGDWFPDGSIAAAGGVPSTRRGSIDLSLGNYSVFEIDLRLPAPGFSWTIGRCFNGVQKDSSSTAFDSDGYQGTNWSQLSQPEIIFYDDADNSKDMVYLVTSAGSFVEFVRFDSSSSTFKGRNGAVGAFVYAAGSHGQPDLYTYTGQHGYKATFFGFDTNAGAAMGQLWKLEDPSGNTAYVGSTSSASAAVSAGYDGSGRITTAFDTANRRYSYSYSGSAIGGAIRLAQVLCERLTGGSWTSSPTTATVATVAYAYHDSSGGGGTTYGDAGNLKQVTVTVPLTDSGVDSIRNRYYRYWTGTFNASTNPGHPNLLQYIVDPEGVRGFDWSDSNFDDDHFTASESSLKPYAKQYFTYDSARAIISTWQNGACGCSGGAGNGVETIAYSTNGSFSNTSTYDTAWKARAIIKLPPETEAATYPYITQFFDEVGQSLGRALTEGNPAYISSPPPQWSTNATRDSDGFVTAVSLPDNITAYDHYTAVFTRSTSVGRYFLTSRVSSGELFGFVSQITHGTTGTSGTQYFDGTLTYPADASLQKMTVGAITIPRALPSASRSYTQPISTGSTGAVDTSLAFTFHSGAAALMIKRQTITNPTVTTGNNGSGSATSTKVYFRADGTTAFQESADSIFSYTEYSGGQLIRVIADAKTNGSFPSGDDPNTDFGITETGDGLDETTTWSYDYQGRVDIQTLFAGAASPRYLKSYYGRLADQRQVRLAYADYTAATPKFYGPVSYTVANLADRAVSQATVALTSNESTTALTGHVNESSDDIISAMTLGSVVRLATTVFDPSGTQAQEARQYFLVPTSIPGTAGTNFDATTFAYSDAGKRWRTEAADGTVSRSKVDLIGRAKSQWVGTNDNDSQFPGGDSSGTSNMVKVSEVEYDAGAAGAGPSWITKRTLFVQDSATDKRETLYAHDGDGRVGLQTNPQAPHILRKFDHQGLELATGLYSSASGLSASSDPTSVATNRMALTTTSFDELGRAWKRERHQIDPADGSDDDTLEVLSWYDLAGRVAKVDGEQLIKYAFDRLGRQTHEYVLATDDDGTTYANMLTISGDTVLEQHDTVYQPNTGYVVMTGSISRHPDDYGGGATTGALDTNADGSDLKYTASDLEGRVQVSCSWFDRFGRVTDTAFYGAFTTTDLDRAAITTAPSRADTVLVTTTTFDTDGTVLETTDPKALKTRFLYDQAGRTTATIGNYVNGTPSGVNGDDDVYTRYVYAAGHQTKMWVDFDGDGSEDSDDQVTTYTYGVTKGTSAGDSKISSGALLQKVTYPDSSSGSDVVTFAYNALGQLIWTKDQAGNILETDFDTAGRETHRKVTTLASGFDGAVRRVSSTYDNLGRTTLVTSWSDASPGSGSVVNEVGYEFDGWSNLTEYSQDPDSALGSSGAGPYDVSYVLAKATSGRNTLRRTSQTLCGKTWTLDYDTGNLDSVASRVTYIKESSTEIARYWYVGQSDLVGRVFAEPDIFWNQFTAGTPATYPDRDRFNRITSSRWTKDLTTDSDFVDLDVVYDRNSNVVSADDAVLAGNDVLYANDSLNRLTDADEGTLSGGAITSRTRRQTWTLSQTGNWATTMLDLNGDNDGTDGGEELNETRTHNTVNEILTRDKESNSSVDYTLTHDAVGNLTDDGQTWKYVYDAFGRLTALKNQSSTTIAEYTYYGNNVRASERYDVEPDGDLDSNDKTYRFAWDEGWRLVAVYRESDSDPKERYLHDKAGASGFGGSSYIDDLILRDRDANSGWTSAADGTLEERRYFCQSWRHDVVALVNSIGELAERARYSAYGVPYGCPLGDASGDGIVNGSDTGTVLGAWGSSSPQGDLNLDGTVNGSDLGIVSGNWMVSLGRGKLSLIGNRFGYASYESALISSLFLQVRERSYLPTLGRWTSRDPLGVGSSLYEYSGSQAISATDPYGLVQIGVCTAGGCGGGLTVIQGAGGQVAPASTPVDTSGVCEKLKHCFNDNDFVKLAMAYVNQACKGGGRYPSETGKCGRETPWKIVCEKPEGDDHTGSTTCHDCKIRIDPSGDCITIAHELIHAGDFCALGYCPNTAKGGFGDPCSLTLCSEIRAYTLQCCSELSKPNMKPSKEQLKDCAEKKLLGDPTKNIPGIPTFEKCKKQDSTMWDYIWSTCFDPSICEKVPPFPQLPGPKGTPADKPLDLPVLPKKRKEGTPWSKPVPVVPGE